MGKNTLIHNISFLLSLIGLIVMIFDLGFEHSENLTTTYNIFYVSVLVIGVISSSMRYYLNESLPNKGVIIFDVLSTLFSIFVLAKHFIFLDVQLLKSLAVNDHWLRFAIILTFIRESSDIKISIDRTILNPA